MNNAVLIIIDGKTVEIQFPVSLIRDAFAMAAMQGLLASFKSACSPSKVAFESYRYADEMIAEMKKS